MQLPALNSPRVNVKAGLPGRHPESGLQARLAALAREVAGLAGLMVVQISLYYLTALVGHAAN